MNDKPIKIVCADCGSDNVRRNADVAWNVETQEWDQIAAVFDNGSCEDCGNSDASLEEVQIEEERDDA
jgi:hypothetical protein